MLPAVVGKSTEKHTVHKLLTDKDASINIHYNTKKIHYHRWHDVQNSITLKYSINDY